MVQISTAGSGATVWPTWCSTTATTTASVSDPWITWVTGSNDCTAATVNSTTSTAVWTTWVEATNFVETPAPSEEQRNAWQAEAERQRVRAEAEKVKREAAEKRAQELLESILEIEERERLRAHGHIFVRGRSGCRYRVRKGRTHNIDVVGRDGRVTHEACVHVQPMTPDYDNMLAQKLMLEDDDEALMKIANRSPRNGGQPVMEQLH